MFENKTILITGGTGSFGKAFLYECLLNHDPKKVIVYSRDENKQFHIAQDVSEKFPGKKNRVRFFIGDVRDLARLRLAFREVDIVVHAAALKHVPIAEYNPFECINTNVIGAQNVITAAIENGVSRTIALSTDKAANPINLYGASKLASDKIFVAANNLAGSTDVRFSVVRYGNVFGSRGSVIPYFQKLLSQGSKSLPVTDERMTRFWITLSQGVRFVISCLDEMVGAEIFVPKISSMRVVDVVKYMDPTVKIELIGIRPGEKLHETMISVDDARDTLEFEDKFVILPPKLAYYGDRIKYKGGKAVSEEFSYSSDKNDTWLGKEEFQRILTTLS